MRLAALAVVLLAPLAHAGDCEVVFPAGPEAVAVVAPGPHRVLVEVLDFADAPVRCSDADAASVMWSGARSVDGLYREITGGALSFYGDVVRVQIAASVTETGCPSGTTWQAAGDAAARAAGYDPASYLHVVQVLPDAVKCSWAGRAYLGCLNQPCRVWIRTCSAPDVWAHEIGHNLGMMHAGTAAAPEYGDISDIMGTGGNGWRRINAIHAFDQSWTPAEYANASGTYHLAPLEATSGTRVLRSGDYYISYRAPLGYDTTLSTNYSLKTSVHAWVGGTSPNTLLLAVLRDGESWTGGALTVTQLHHDTAGADVRLDFGGMPAVQHVHRTDLEGL